MSETSGEQKVMWDLLLEIKDDLRSLDKRLEHTVGENSETRAHLKYLCGQVGDLNKLIVQGNGQKSILVQLTQLHVEVDSIKKELENNSNITKFSGELLQKVLNVPISASEARKQKWLTIGKVAGVAILLIPGILAFLGVSN